MIAIKVFLGVFLSVLFGSYMAGRVVLYQLKKSNDFGNSKGRYKDFSNQSSLQITYSKDNVGDKEGLYKMMIHP